MEKVQHREATKVTVLVVEERAELRAVLCGVLEEAGHRVLEATSSKAGVAAIETNSIELIVTDILMADLSGLDVVKQAVRRRPSVPIIAISGGGRHISAVESLLMARLTGATQILYKPFRKKELLSAVNDALGSKPT